MKSKDYIVINQVQLNENDLKLWNEVKNKTIPIIKNLIHDQPTHHLKVSYKTFLPYILDLHGYTIQEAYNKLNAFIDKHIIYKTKYITVITGKGSYTKEGLIHKEIENWLSTKVFNTKIKNFEWINGNGALKIFLKS